MERRVKQNIEKNLKNSQRVKGKRGNEPTKAEISETETSLPNNWLKYEISEHEEIKGDFEALSNEPICEDSYFKFKSEQNWENDIKKLQLSKYFTLDLRVLNEGILCVPFQRRQNINSSLFSATEQDVFNKTATGYLVKYEKSRNQKVTAKNSKASKAKKCTYNENLNSPVISESKVYEKEAEHKNIDVNIKFQDENNKDLKKLYSIKKPSEEVHKKLNLVVENENKTVNSTGDDLDELLNLKLGSIQLAESRIQPAVEDPLLSVDTVKNITPQTAVDLEQWLEDILDD